jgi:hypothetical protein
VETVETVQPDTTFRTMETVRCEAASGSTVSIVLYTARTACMKVVRV